MKTTKQLKIDLSNNDVGDMLMAYADQYLIHTEDNKDYLLVDNEKIFIKPETRFQLGWDNTGRVSIIITNV